MSGYLFSITRALSHACLPLFRPTRRRRRSRAAACTGSVCLRSLFSAERAWRQAQGKTPAPRSRDARDACRAPLHAGARMRSPRWDCTLPPPRSALIFPIPPVTPCAQRGAPPSATATRRTQQNPEPSRNELGRGQITPHRGAPNLSGELVFVSPLRLRRA